jgi:hypothetical protein
MRENAMTNAELTEFNKNRKIRQIAFLVYDVEKAMRKFVDLLDIGPWTVLVMDDIICTGVIEKGQPSSEPFKFYCAVTMIGETQIELIQPCYGVAAYTEWMEKHGEGLHHIKEQVSDETIEDAVKKYEAKGMKITRAGHYLEDDHRYLDSLGTLGFQYEIGNCADCSITEDMYYIFPRED